LQRGECRAPFACAFAGLSPARALPVIRRRVELAVGLGLGALRYAPGEQLGEGLNFLNIVGGDRFLPGILALSILLEARPRAARSAQA
jgi:hypothetical protein